MDDLGLGMYWQFFCFEEYGEIPVEKSQTHLGLFLEEWYVDTHTMMQKPRDTFRVEEVVQS